MARSSGLLEALGHRAGLVDRELVVLAVPRGGLAALGLRRLLALLAGHRLRAGLLAEAHECLLAGAVAVELLGRAEAAAAAPVDEALPHRRLDDVAVLHVRLAGERRPVQPRAVELHAAAESGVEERLADRARAHARLLRDG